MDQVIDRILYLPMVGVETREPMLGVNKAGWAPFPGGYQRLKTAFPEDASLAVDKTAWDWTMPGWCVEAYFKVKLSQCSNLSDRYVRLCHARSSYVVGPRARIVMPDGLSYRQVEWGLMKSGWLLTISMNGLAQCFQHCLAWHRMGSHISAPPMWALGDDSLVKWYGHDLDLYLAQLRQTGCIVKHGLLRREFAGFLYKSNSVEPLYPERHKMTLKYCAQGNEQDLLVCMTMMYALASERWIDAYITKYAGIDLRAACRAWARGLLDLKVLEGIPADWSRWF